MFCFPLLLFMLSLPPEEPSSGLLHIAQEIDLGRITPRVESEFVVETSFPFTESMRIRSLSGSCGCSEVTLLSSPLVEPNSPVRFQLKIRPDQQTWETRGFSIYFDFEPSADGRTARGVQSMRYQPTSEFAFVAEPVYLEVDPLDADSRVITVGNFGRETVTKAFARVKGASGVEHIVTGELTDAILSVYPRQLIPFPLPAALVEDFLANSKESEISVHVATDQATLFRKVLVGKLVVEAVSSVKVVPQIVFQPPEGPLTLNLVSPNSAIDLGRATIELLDSASTKIPFDRVAVKDAWVRVSVDSTQVKNHAKSRKSPFRFKIIDPKGVEFHVPFTVIGDHANPIR